ncbi:MAG: hypothetical protein IMZ63_01845 [Actinobacteria bacterium]|nr:hypothetical protein [Actinomycetota bacterium]
MKETFIGEIEKHVDSMKPQRQMKHSWRTKKLARRLTIPGVLLIVISMIGIGALIYTLTQYDIQMQGAVTLEGQEEVSNILWDGTRLTQAMTEISVMDFPVITYEDGLLQSTHTVQNIDGGTWDITLDTSGMPINGGGDPQDPFYGFLFWIWKDGANVTTFELAPETTVTLTFCYKLDPLFLETINDFPFLLEIEIKLQTEPTLPEIYETEYRGILTQCLIDGSNMIIVGNDNPTLVSSGDGYTYILDRPLGFTDFTNYSCTNSRVNWIDSRGILFYGGGGVEGGEPFKTVMVSNNPETRRGQNSILQASFKADTLGVSEGLVLNGDITGANYDIITLDYALQAIKYVHIVNSVPTTATFAYTLVPETTYTLKVIETQGVSIEVLIGGISIHTFAQL